MSGTKNLKKMSGLRKVLLVILAVIFISGIVFLVKTQVIEAGPCKGSPNDPFYEEAAETIQRGKPEEMKKLVTKIEKIKGYDKDANCLYPVFAYNITPSGTEPVLPIYTKTVAVYKPSKDFSPSYARIGMNNLDDLKQQLLKYMDDTSKATASRVLN